MLGFSSVGKSTSTIMDAYSSIQETKNNAIATVIANNRGSKERVGATAIGAGFGVAQSAAFAGVYGLAKYFPALQKFSPVKWVVNKFDKWIDIAKKNNPTGTKFDHIRTGILAKSMWAIASCAVTGFVLDYVNNKIQTRKNGKCANSKQGYLDDSWLLAGIKSLSGTKEGKKIIRNAMSPTDDGVVIKFKGVDREYKVTNKEIKNASREYITLFNGDKVKGYKKHYSNSDGDVLAFEIAFKKYQADLKDGKICANRFLPQCANQYSSNGTLSETEVSQFYFMLTGKAPDEIKNDSSNFAEKVKLDKFLADFKTNPKNMAANFTLKKDCSDKMQLKGLLTDKIDLKANKTFAIKSVGDKFMKIVDTRNTALEYMVSVDDFKSNFDKIYRVDL